MSWRNAKDLRTRQNDGDILDRMTSALTRDEQVFVVASPEQFYDEWGKRLDVALSLVLTSERLILGARGLFKAKTVEYSVGDLLGYKVDLFMGGGPSWELIMKTPGGLIKLVFETKDEADGVASYVNDAFALWTSRNS